MKKTQKNVKETQKKEGGKPMKNHLKSNKNRFKYDADYIAYIEDGESGAVFITRDIAEDIETSGKWIDVVEVEHEVLEERYKLEGKLRYRDFDYTDEVREYRINDYKYFVVELFDRREHPKYSEGMSKEEKKYVTWETATRDICKQRNAGVTGPKYLVIPKLIKTTIGKGKYQLEKEESYGFCRRTYGKFVVTQKPKWEYEIIAAKKLSNKEYNYICKNLYSIESKIQKNKLVKLEYFNIK